MMVCKFTSSLKIIKSSLLETKKEGYVLEIVSILLGLVFLIIVCCAYRLEARESSERLSLLDQNYEGYGLNLPISTGLMFTSSNGWKGLTETEFRRIKEFVYNSNYNDEDKCAICLMEYLDGDVVKNLPCNHLFHKVCASSWLTRNGCCPLCKSDVSKLLSMSNENNFT